MPNWEALANNETPKIDWEQAAAYYEGKRSGGTFETVHGGPQVPKLKDSPDSLGTRVAAVAATIEDPQAKLRYLAAQRFPAQPIHESMSRYGYMNGDPVYSGDDGSLYREFPRFRDKAAGFVAGNVPQMVGGAAGGARFGWPGAAIGSALGLAGRKAVGAAHGDPRSLQGDAFDLGIEALLNAGGWKLGEVVGRKMIDRRVVKDIGRFDKAKAGELQRVANEYFGIDLTPAETTELGSLINQQTRLGMGMDEAGDVIRQFLQKRAGQVDTAVDKYIGTTPPADVVGKRARSVMAQTIDDAKAARSTASSPIYKSTIRQDVLVPEKDIERFLADDYTRSIFDKVSTDPRYGVLDHPNNSTSKIDAVKKAIDDEIGELNRKGNNNAAKILAAKKQALVKYTDELYPSYKDARHAFASQSEYVDELEGGLEGVIAGLKDVSLRDAAKKLLDPRQASPVDVSRARKAFASQGRQEDWNNVVRSYLRDIWEGAATKDVQSGANSKAGANFRKAVFGTKRQKQMMREALGPEDFATFHRLMDVLEATGRVPGGQSMTEPAMQAAKQEAREAAPVVSFAGDTAKLRLGQWWTDVKAGEWRTTLAKAITSPEAISELEKLRKLKGLSPWSQKSIDITTTALTKAGVYGPAALLESESNQLPTATQGQAPQ